MEGICCVSWLYVYLCGTQWAQSLFLTLSHCSCFHRWWEKLTLRWNGRRSWRSAPSQRKVTNPWYFSHISALWFISSLSPIFLCSRRLIYYCLFTVTHIRCIAFKPNSCFHIDPHVKVEGKRANVLEAKKKILEVLETRVRTLKFTICLNNNVNNEDILLHVFYFATTSLQSKLFGKINK